MESCVHDHIKGKEFKRRRLFPILANCFFNSGIYHGILKADIVKICFLLDIQCTRRPISKVSSLRVGRFQRPGSRNFSHLLIEEGADLLESIWYEALRCLKLRLDAKGISNTSFTSARNAVTASILYLRRFWHRC